MLDDEPFVELPAPSSHRKRPRTALHRRNDLNSLESDVEHADPFIKPTVTTSPPLDLFEEAKRLFHRSAAVRIVGRTAERAFIEKFWREAWSAKASSPSVLYICGNPGCGKTALVSEMLPELEDNLDDLLVIKANCMMFSDPREALEVIGKDLNVILPRRRKNFTTNKWTEIIDLIDVNLRTRRKDSRIAIVLDEIDQIAVKDTTLLRRIFDWPCLDGLQPKVIVIGIANSLDLSIKYCQQGSEQGSVLNFAPYSPEDIARILMARLELANAYQQENKTNRETEIISSMAIEICARKVSAVGDLRRALEIMQDALGIAAREHKDHKGAKVEIKHVVMAMERVFGTTVRTASRHAQLISELNLHQKLLLAPLCRLLKDSPTTRPTVQSLFELYTVGVRTHRIIDAVSRSEFNDLVANSESMGVISLVAPGKRAGNKVAMGGAVQAETKVLLAVPLEDAVTGLSDNPVLKKLLD